MSEVISTVKNKIQTITLNRPNKRNAMTIPMYTVLAKLINDAAVDDNIAFTVLTGAGSYYSSGNDFVSLMSSGLTGDASQFNSLRDFTDSLIRYPKLLVALVNGPAIGIAVTTLGLFDIVIASDTASFHCPFGSLGLCAEGASSYTFPRLLGKAKASELLYLGEKLSVKEAHRLGFVNEIYKHNEVDKAWKRIESFLKIPVTAIKATKRLWRRFETDKLLEVTRAEYSELTELVHTEEFAEAMVKFMNKRKSKL